MHRRKLGNHGFAVSEVGLGCWQLGSDWGATVEESTAFEILQRAVDHGINFFDTADVYGAGRSERLIGEFLKTVEAPVHVATKFGRFGDVYPDGYTESALRKGVEASLKRLDLEVLDLVQLHCIPTRVLRQGAIFDWLRALQEEGLIRHFGASVESVEEGMICLEQEGLLSLQVIYNLFRQKLQDEFLPHAAGKGVGIIVRLPLASGLLTGKFSRATTFADSDHRNYNRDGKAFNVGETFAGMPFETGVELAETIQTEFKPEGMTMAQFSLRWLLDHLAVTTVIPGASRPEQVAMNASASEIPALGNRLHERLKAFYEEQIHDQIRGAY